MAATVNGTDIPVSDVEERFEKAKTQPQVAQQLEGDTEGVFESELQAQILTQLVVSNLLEEWASDLDVTATDEEVDEERTALIEQLGGEEAFQQAVEQSGLSEEDVNEQIRQRVLQNKITEEVGGEGEVTDAEIEDFYKQNQATRFGDKATARHILVKKESEADKIFADLKKGADFAKIAKAESTDPGSAEQGGELPEFGPGQMVPEFDEAVFSGEVGKLIGPVKTEFGYHIIEVLDKKPGQELADVREEIRTELAQTQSGDVVQKELQKRTKEAEVTVNPRFGTWNAETATVDPAKSAGDASESGSEGPGGVPSEGVSGAPAPDPSGAPAVPTESATQ